jgi:putative copper resistance protein D
VTTRLPRLALAAWVFAAAIVVALVVAVVHYLSGDNGAAHMHMSSAEALTRGGGGTPTQPLSDRIFTAWQLDAIAVAVLVIVAAAYLSGVARVASGTDRRWPMRRTLSFFAGLAVCAFATNGSIAVYDQVLFTAHMAGHLALVMLAPVLLVAGHPLSLAVEASSPEHRERILRVARGRVVALLTSPPVALAAYAAVLVGSHLTGLMDTIMSNT